MSFYIHTDAYPDVNVVMGIGILIPEAMISKSTIDKIASVDDKEILTVKNNVTQILRQFASAIKLLSQKLVKKQVLNLRTK